MEPKPIELTAEHDEQFIICAKEASERVKRAALERASDYLKEIYKKIFQYSGEGEDQYCYKFSPDVNLKVMGAVKEKLEYNGYTVTLNTEEGEMCIDWRSPKTL